MCLVSRLRLLLLVLRLRLLLMVLPAPLLAALLLDCVRSVLLVRRATVMYVPLRRPVLLMVGLRAAALAAVCSVAKRPRAAEMASSNVAPVLLGL